MVQLSTYQSIRNDAADRANSFLGNIGERLLGTVWIGPDLLVFVGRLVSDERIPQSDRRDLLTGLSFLLSPIGFPLAALLRDPEMGPMARDAMHAVHRVLNETEPTIVRECWPGHPEALDRLQGVAREANGIAEEGLVIGVRRRVRQTRHKLEARLRALLPYKPSNTPED